MHVVLAGASGLIGTALARSLREQGHDVTRLVRGAADEPDTATWDPTAHQLDPATLQGADAVVCLSGLPVAGRRWTADFKRRLVRSRTDSVGTIARTLAEHGGPRVLVCASAVGYYGDTGDREIDESEPAGDSFLADLCVQWEAAAAPARDAGVRVTNLRTGLVLARDGGLLKPLRLLVSTGLGGKLGSGRQYMPWISLTDEIAAIEFALTHDLVGGINLTGPAPVRNEEFTKTLGGLLHRPTVLAVPAFAARIALGEFAWNALTGQNAIPRRLLDAGFSFTHRDLESALRAELAR